MRITHLLLAAAASVAMNAAHAVGASYDYPGDQPNAATRSRAEVVAEIAQARENGLLNPRDGEYPADPRQVTQRTHAEVRAELIEFRKNPGQAADIYFGG